MKCCYINLDAAEARRAAIEASFRAISPANWELARFPAVPAGAVAELPGDITPVEKAVFCSHRNLITASLDDEEHLFVVEDDMAFVSSCFEVLDATLAERQDWDVIYTESLISDLDMMVRLLKARAGLVSQGDNLLVSLGKVKFAGATSYVVNGRSKAKLAGLLARAEPLNLPYDIALRRLAENGHVRSYALFPFLTYMSGTAESSQVQPPSLAPADFILNTLRRLMCLERDMEECRRAAEHIRTAFCTEDDLLAGAVVAGIISATFPAQR